MKEFLAKFLSHDAGPLAQFFKYAIVGAMSAGVHISLFFILGRFCMPCLSKDDMVLKLLGRFRFFAVDDNYFKRVEANRARNAAICNFIAFTLSDIFCYILNRLFVFSPGRYSMIVEFLFFFAVSGISCVIGTTLQTLLISRAKVQTTIAFGMNILAGLAINYIVRKLFVFNG